ncbi:MAG TPA: HAMP domain-containing protein [Gammaproteobacteria bacterium]|nr:HAMP domain-containing protein [Gammaproteobacteria bacterium]
MRKIRLLSNLSVRTKVWGGFGLLLLLTVAVAAVAWRSMFTIEGEFSELVERDQPLMLASQSLARSLAQASSAMGFFLLGEEESARQPFLDALDQVAADLAALRENARQYNSALQARVEALAAQVEQFMSYRDRMLELAGNRLANMNGLQFAATHLNPISQQMLQLTGQMLSSEFEEEASMERRALLNEIHGLRYAWTNVMNGVRAYMSFRGQRSLDEIKLYSELTDTKIKELAAFENELTFEQDDALSQFIELKQQFMDNLEKMKEIEANGNWREDIGLIRGEIAPLLKEINRHLGGLVEGRRRATVAATGDVLSDLRHGLGLIGGLLLIALGVGLGVSFLASRQIVAPILRLRDVLRDMAEGEGDLTQRVPLASNDELGQASKYFNHVMAGLQEMMQQIRQAADEVLAGARSSSERVQAVLGNVSEAAERTRSTAAATEEMSAISADIAGSAETAAGEAEQAREQAQQGTAAMREMADKAGVMETEVQRLQSSVAAIEDKGRSMESMVAVINEIAEQTNLLALNAAIEAARAGEAGRGFAVVADEVRQLASKTQQSTAGIHELLESNRRTNRELVSAMGQVAEAGGSVSRSVSEAGRVIERMADSVGLMNDMVESIARAAREQSDASREIASNVELLSASESENADLMSATAGEMSGFGETANRLKTLVDRFRA